MKSTVEFSSKYGSQTDRSFRVTNLKKTSDADFNYYDMTIEIDCNLYEWARDGLPEGGFAGRLIGTHKIMATIPIE